MSRACLTPTLLAAIAFGATPPASAQTFTWQGGAANNNWSLAGNWTTAAPPNDGLADVVFTDIFFVGIPYLTPNMDASYSIDSLTFSGSNTFNLLSGSNRTLTIGAGGLIQGSSASQAINFPVLVSQPQTWTFSGTGNLALADGVNINQQTLTVTTAGTNTLTGVITGTAALIKLGAGALTLSGAGSTLNNLEIKGGSAVMNGGSLTLTSVTNDITVALNVQSGASLMIQNGAMLSTNAAGMGGAFIDGSSSPSVTVDGTGTVWTAGNQIVAGNGAVGRLTVQNGGAVTGANVVSIGVEFGSTGTLTIQSGSTVSDQTGSLGNLSGATGTATVTGAGSKWTNLSSLNVGGKDASDFGGNGFLSVTNGGSATSVNGLNFWSAGSSVTVDGGTVTAGNLQTKAGTGASVFLTDPAGGPALTVGSDNTSRTYVGSIADSPDGPGTVMKIGAGTETLTGHLSNTGGYNVTGGTLEFSGAVVQPGSGSLTAGADGTVQYDNGARVFGGFLRGPGVHVVTGGAILSGVTAFSDAVINETGPASFVNFTNGAAMLVAAGATLNGFTNEGSGSIVVGARVSFDVSSFQTYGTLTLLPGQSMNAPTLLTNTGTSPLHFNGGSRTFIGTPATATSGGQPTFVAGMDLEGQNLVIAGGLFVNNGFVSDYSSGTKGSIIVDFGALYKGAGFTGVSIVTQNGGKVQAGNSPGSASFGTFVFGPGGVNNYVFAIDDATGQDGPSPNAAGQVSGWGLIKAIQQAVGPITTPGNFTWTATPTDKLTFAIDTLVNPTEVGTDVAGPMADFDPILSYSWPAVCWTGAYSGPTDSLALDAATAFDTSGIVNPVAGTFGWNLDAADQTLSLTYTPSAVPEPGSFALVGLAAIGWVRYWRRRWIDETPV